MSGRAVEERSTAQPAGDGLCSRVVGVSSSAVLGAPSPRCARALTNGDARPRRRGAGGVTFTYWALHGSIDWFWEFPGLAAPAFAWLGLAGGLERPAPAAVSSANSEDRVSMPAAAGYTLALVASVVSLGLPWLAAREIDRAANTWRSDPEDAFAILDRARALKR